MKDIKQIQSIHKALTSQKEKFLLELAKVNDVINKKLAVIDKMSHYHNEYENTHNLPYSRSIPILNKNLNMFTQKVRIVIRREEDELKHMQTIQNGIANKIADIDKKMKLMDVFAEKHHQAKQQQADKREQLMLDDLFAAKLRGNQDE